MDETIKDYEIVLTLCSEEFEFYMGRKPKGQDEFDEWSRLAEKGLLNGHINWDLLYRCTCNAMRHDGGDKNG